MSHANEILADSRCAAQLTPVFLERLGNEEQEQFYLRAIDEARRQNLPEIARQAEAWLTFSASTRLFEQRIASP